MTFNYARLRDGTAERLIARFGQTATLTKPGTPTGPAYNPVAGTPTAYTVTVVNKTIKIENRDGTLVQQGDRLFILSTDTTATPEMGDTLTADSELYQIVDVTPLQPGATVMLWYVQCRK